jgi:GcrA cell cycle regulator
MVGRRIKNAGVSSACEKAAPWTKEDNERLKGFVAKGASVIRAAAALNRSIMGVRNQARKMGIPFPPLRATRQKWADTPDNFGRRS